MAVLTPTPFSSRIHYVLFICLSFCCFCISWSIFCLCTYPKNKIFHSFTQRAVESISNGVIMSESLCPCRYIHWSSARLVIVIHSLILPLTTTAHPTHPTHPPGAICEFVTQMFLLLINVTPRLMHLPLMMMCTTRRSGCCIGDCSCRNTATLQLSGGYNAIDDRGH